MVKIILETVKLPAFATTEESQDILNDRTLAAQVESALIEEFSRVKVTAKAGEASIRSVTGLTLTAAVANEEKIIRRVESIAINLGGAERVNVNLSHSVLTECRPRLARIMREPPATTANMAILPGVLGSRTLRRTEQVRLRSESLRLPGGTAISTISLWRLVHNAG